MTLEKQHKITLISFTYHRNIKRKEHQMFSSQTKTSCQIYITLNKGEVNQRRHKHNPQENQARRQPVIELKWKKLTR